MPEFHVRSRQYDGDVEIRSVVNPVIADTETEAIKEIKKLKEYEDYDTYEIEKVIR